MEEESSSMEMVYKEKMSMYLYYFNKEEDKDQKEMNIENIWEMEVMKQYFEQLEELGIDYHPVILQKNDTTFFEKIYYQDPNPIILFYNAAFPIHDFGFTQKVIERALQQLPTNFDILLFKECKDDNQVKKWLEDVQHMPTFAVIRKDAFFKIIYKMWNQIQVYYSSENISKSFYTKWEDYLNEKFDNIFDWFGETIFSI